MNVAALQEALDAVLADVKNATNVSDRHAAVINVLRFSEALTNLYSLPVAKARAPVKILQGGRK